MSVRSYLVSFDTLSIVTRHETSSELSNSSGDNAVAIHFVLLAL